MPDLGRLHDFLGRTQEHMQDAIRRGDRAAVDMYSQFLDRANALGDRVLGKVTGQFPVSADNSEPTPYNPGQGVPTSQMPGEWFMAGDEPAQTNQALVPPGAGDTPTPALQQQSTQKLSAPPLIDLQSLNARGPDKLTLDLNSEVKSPFSSAPTNPVSKAMQLYPSTGASPTPSPYAPSEYEHVSSNEPEPAAPSVNLAPWMGAIGPDASAGMLPEGASFPSVPPGDAAKAILSGAALGPVGLLAKGAYNSMGGLSSVAGVNAPGHIVPASNEAIKKKWEAENKLYDITPGNTAQQAENAVVNGEPETMPRDWDINPSLRAKWDAVTGMSAADQAKHAADFERDKEFERRVKQEVGNKPGFLEQLLAVIFGGAQGAAQSSHNRQQYYAGRARVGQEMRGEVRHAQDQAVTQMKQEMDRKIEQQKTYSIFITPAVRAAQKPFLQKADALRAEIDSILRQPGYDSTKPDPMLDAKRRQLDVAIEQADKIAQANLGSFMKFPGQGTDQ